MLNGFQGKPRVSPKVGTSFAWALGRVNTGYHLFARISLFCYLMFWGVEFSERRAIILVADDKLPGPEAGIDARDLPGAQVERIVALPEVPVLPHLPDHLACTCRLYISSYLSSIPLVFVMGKQQYEDFSRTRQGVQDSRAPSSVSFEAGEPQCLLQIRPSSSIHSLTLSFLSQLTIVVDVTMSCGWVNGYILQHSVVIGADKVLERVVRQRIRCITLSILDVDGGVDQVHRPSHAEEDAAAVRAQHRRCERAPRAEQLQSGHTPVAWLGDVLLHLLYVACYGFLQKQCETVEVLSSSGMTTSRCAAAAYNTPLNVQSS